MCPSQYSEEAGTGEAELTSAEYERSCRALFSGSLATDQRQVRRKPSRKQGEELSSGGHGPFMAKALLSQVAVPKEGTAVLPLLSHATRVPQTRERAQQALSHQLSTTPAQGGRPVHRCAV